MEDGSQDPLRQAMGGVLMMGDHAPLSIGSDAAVMADSPRRPFDGLKPIYVCRTFYAARALRIYLQSLPKRGRLADNRLRHIWRINGMNVKGSFLWLLLKLLASDSTCFVLHFLRKTTPMYLFAHLLYLRVIK